MTGEEGINEDQQHGLTYLPSACTLALEEHCGSGATLNQQARALAEKLRSLGIDPDQII
jgi:hypothetical protein